MPTTINAINQSAPPALRDVIFGGDVVYSEDDSLNNTDLNQSVLTGTYRLAIDIVLDNGAGGFKCDLGGGTATANLCQCVAVFASLTGAAGDVLADRMTTLTDSVSAGATEEVKSLSIRGVLTFDAAGTFIFRASQNSSNADPSTLYNGASMILTRLSS